MIPNSNLNENRNLSLDKKGLKIENFIKNDRKNSVDNNNDDISKYKNQGKNTYSEKISKLMNKEYLLLFIIKFSNNFFCFRTKIKIEANKTNNLMNSSALSSKSYEYLQNKNSSDEKEEEVEKLNKKLEKNRESARNSRKRKKIYIQLLENKVKYIIKTAILF